MDVVEHDGGILYNDQSFVLLDIRNVDKNYDPDDESNHPTTEELTEFKATAHDKALAIAFFLNAQIRPVMGPSSTILKINSRLVRISTHVTFHLPSQLSTAMLSLVQSLLHSIHTVHKIPMIPVFIWHSLK